MSANVDMRSVTATPVSETVSTTKQPLRVAIADDHRLMLDGIKRALETAPDIRVVGEAMSGDEMLTIVPKVNPDVVILDLRMPRGSQGAAGYVVKSINPLDLPSTIRQVVEGTVYHPAGRGGGGEGAGAAPTPAPGGLTERELAILRLVAEGMSNLDIASRLYVTEQTVKFHLSNIYRKLGVANRTEATRYAYRNGLID